jgi:hypothetical protein
VVEELLKAGAAPDVHHRGMDGRSAVDVARDEQYTHFIDVLTRGRDEHTETII